ncbi:MAG: tungstate ABC transporter substrate-binding protein WtpA [Pyrodictiaceae archaeon]
MVDGLKAGISVLASVIAVAAILAIAWYLVVGGGGRAVTEIRVCSAGSLTMPLRVLAAGFEREYGVRVLVEPSGSVEAVRKVTDLGRSCDVVAVADYRLIPMFMMPRYADWYVVFATNSMVVAFTDNSRYANEAGGASIGIVDILARPGVSYGFSDPNRDPCGYRAVGIIGLIALEKRDLSILERLVIDKIPGSSYQLVNGTLHIYIPPTIKPRDGLIIRPKGIDLVSLLESGSIDYAFEYRSVAVQHGLRYVELPASVNLADPGLAKKYSRVVVHILVGTGKEKEIPITPIAYGTTIPKNAEHPREALLFVKYLLEHGRRVFGERGQLFLEKPLGYGKVPEELKGLVAVEKG